MLKFVKSAIKRYLFKRWGIRRRIKLDLILSKGYYRELQDLLHIAKVEGVDLVRIGHEYDGGYIMLNDFHDGGIAYSFGISNDVSWDKDMASRGYDVFMYDHTIDELPEQNPHFHWSKLGIADGETRDDRLKTIDELIKQNHHEDKRNMILKMDVEGAEWGFLSQVDSETLSQFSQITLEFHNVINNRDTKQVLEALRKLNITHQLIHVHANNYKNYYIVLGGKKICPVLELTYALRSNYSFIEDYDIVLPLDLDAPNNPLQPEIELGRWNAQVNAGERFSVCVRVL